MSKLSVNELTDETGSGAPSFPNGVSVTGAALTDPEITGGIYLGGTGSANYLDDYEEGTWTPEFTSSDADPSSSIYRFNAGTYVKTGSLVVATLRMRSNDITWNGSEGGNALIKGLPFTSEPTGDVIWSGAVSRARFFVTDQPCGLAVANDSNICHLFYRNSADGEVFFLEYDKLGTGSSSNEIWATAIYRTTV